MDAEDVTFNFGPSCQFTETEKEGERGGVKECVIKLTVSMGFDVEITPEIVMREPN
jgi:hypothetical protein